MAQASCLLLSFFDLVSSIFLIFKHFNQVQREVLGTIELCKNELRGVRKFEAAHLKCPSHFLSASGYPV
jgi:hypothetical protein